MKDYFLIARITAAAGNNGFLRIQSYSDFPDRFFELKYVYIDFFSEKKKFIIEEVRQKKDHLLIKFKNFNSGQDARMLVGKDILIDEENLVKLPEDHYFIHDLIGSKVYRNEKFLGTISDVLNLPANDVYVLNDSDGNEILIPAVKDLIQNFNKEKKELILKPGEDLYEDDED